MRTVTLDADRFIAPLVARLAALEAERDAVRTRMEELGQDYASYLQPLTPMQADIVRVLREPSEFAKKLTFSTREATGDLRP